MISVIGKSNSAMRDDVGSEVIIGLIDANSFLRVAGMKIGRPGKIEEKLGICCHAIRNSRLYMRGRL